MVDIGVCAIAQGTNKAIAVSEYVDDLMQSVINRRKVKQTYAEADAGTSGVNKPPSLCLDCKRRVSKDDIEQQHVSRFNL